MLLLYKIVLYCYVTVQVNNWLKSQQLGKTLNSQESWHVTPMLTCHTIQGHSEHFRALSVNIQGISNWYCVSIGTVCTGVTIREQCLHVTVMLTCHTDADPHHWLMPFHSQIYVEERSHVCFTNSLSSLDSFLVPYGVLFPLTPCKTRTDAVVQYQ